MRSSKIFSLLCAAFSLVSGAQLEINLGQVEATSSLGNLTLYPVEIRADILRNILQHALDDLKKPTNGQKPFYQFNETDWTYEISGSGKADLTSDDLTAITQKALDVAPPSSQDATKTVVGVIKAAGEPIADVVINPRQPASLPKHPKPPLFPKRTRPSIPVTIQTFDSNTPVTQTFIPDNDPALSWFIDRFRALPSDPNDNDLSSNMTSQPSDNTDDKTTTSVSPLKHRRRRRDVGGTGTSKMVNDILGMRRVFPLGNTGFASKMWIWRDQSQTSPIVRVTKVKHMRSAIQAAMNAIPLHIEANKRDNTRPYNEFESITSDGFETPEGTEVIFEAWSAKSIYEANLPPTKIIDFVWQELGKGLLNMLAGRGDEDITMALEGFLMNTAVYGEPEPFGHVRLMCLTKQELFGGVQGEVEGTKTMNGTTSGASSGTPLLNEAAVARRSS